MGVTEVEALARLRAVGVPLAADEAVVSLEAAERLIGASAVDLLVLKPMRLGGLRPALAIARRAAEAGIECIATTTFDSSIGTAVALHLAAALPGGSRRAHGLSTGDHLAARPRREAAAAERRAARGALEPRPRRRGGRREPRGAGDRAVGGTAAGLTARPPAGENGAADRQEYRHYECRSPLVFRPSLPLHGCV